MELPWRQAPEDVAELVRALDLDALTDRLVTAILDEDATYAGGGDSLHTDLRRSCRENLERILAALTGDLPADADPLAAPRETGARRAAQQVPLESVLHAYRLGFRTIWEGLVLQARLTPAAGRVESLVEAASVVWEVVEAFTDTVAGSYRSTEHALARRDGIRRDAAMDALLEGRTHERGALSQVAAVLDLPERGPFAVVLLDSARLSGDPTSVRSALAVRGARVVWRDRADGDLGVLALRTTGTGPLAALLASLPGVRAGISPVVDSLADIAEAASLAGTALRTLGAEEVAVVELDSRLPAALVASSPDLAGRLLHRTLGPVLALEDDERDLLLTTLQAWLRCDGSAGRTAEHLFCHRNTVLNRIRRFEAVSGLSTTDLAGLTRLSLALLALELPGTARPAAPER